MYHKVCLMGVHGVGKTTYMQREEFNNYKKYEEIVRELMDNRSISKEPSKSDQELIYNLKVEQFHSFLNHKGNAIIDRSHFDVLAYSLNKGFTDFAEVKDIIKTHKPLLIENHIHFLYLDPTKNKNFQLIGDDYRSDNIHFFNEVAKEMYSIFDTLLSTNINGKIIADYWMEKI